MVYRTAVTARTVLFFAPVKHRRLVSLLGFYQADIQALRALGCEVLIAHTLPEAARLFRRCDLLYAWWWHKSLLPVFVFRLMRRKVIVTGATNTRSSLVSRPRTRTILTSLTARLADANVAISEYEAEDLLSLGAQRVRMLYPGVRVEEVSAEKSPNPSGVMVAQLNGPSIERKGVDIAVAATRLVRKVHGDFELHLIGPITPDGAAWLAEQALDGVYVHGELPGVERDTLVSRSWVYVQPSRYEGFGLAMAEAMALGIPVVGCRSGAVPEVVGSGGVIVDEISPHAVADGIIGLLSARDNLRVLGESARQEATRFAFDGRVDRLRTILLEIGIS